MTKMFSQTYIEYSRCNISPGLNNVLNNNPSLALDVHIARKSVSSGIAFEVVIDSIRCNGPITNKRGSPEDNEYIVEELKLCLGTIAAGQCAEYPKLAL